MVSTSKPNKKIVDILKEEGEIISNRYNFLSLSENEKNNIINNMIEKTLIFTSTSQVTTLFKAGVEEEFNRLVQAKLSSSDGYKIILKKGFNLEEIIAYYKRYKVELTKETAIILIQKNKKLKEEIKKYLEQTAPENIDGEVAITLISAYAEIENHDISIEKNSKEESTEYDGVKLLLQTTSIEKLLTPEEEIELFEKMKNGDIKAREKLILANNKLVVSIAKKYRTIPLEDAIGEGLEGLIIAIDKFDLNKNVRLSTYAYNWIVAKIQKAILNNRIIKKPADSYKDVLFIKNLQNDYQTKNGTTITVTELSNMSNIPESIVEDALNNNNYISLNNKIGKDKDTELQDCIPDYSIDFVTEIENKELIHYIIRELKKNNIDDDAIKMFIMYFGIGNNEPKNFKEISKIFNTSEQNISSRVNNVLKKAKKICSDNYQGTLNLKINSNIIVFKSKIKKILPYLDGILPKEDIELLNKLKNTVIADMKKNEIDYLINILIPKVKIELDKILLTQNEKDPNNTIFEIMGKYGCDNEIVLEAFNYLPEKYQEVVKRRNGESLKEKIPALNYTLKDQIIFNQKIVKYLKIIVRSLINNIPINTQMFEEHKEVIRKRLTIKEKLGYISDEEYQTLLDGLNEKELELVNLNDTKTIKLTKKNRSDIHSSLMPKLRNRLKKYRKDI